MIWRLVVWRVSAAHSGLMARLGLIPARKNPTTFWRSYPQRARSQVRAACELLASAGLHGRAALVDAPPRKTRRTTRFRNAVSREGFGRGLNAAPIASAWRRKHRYR
jgi:hypothetical protein